MKTILVTGGAGYIGSHTCKALSEKGYQPVVYDNLSEGHRDFVKWGDFVQGEMLDTDCLATTFTKYQPDAVIHFAASAYVKESMQEPQRYYENNLAGSLSLLAAMQKSACKNLVFSSTCSVYGEVETVPIQLTTKPKPINPYGRSKLMVEQVLKDACAGFGLQSVALRYFNAAGADLDSVIGERHIPETHLIPNAINAALKKDQSLSVYGTDYPTVDGTCVRDYVHVADLARAHVMALEYLNKVPGHVVFNVGSGKGNSIRQVIDQIEKRSGRSVNVKYCDRRPGDPAELNADINHTERELGWVPENSDLATVIQSAIDWAITEQERAG